MLSASFLSAVGLAVEAGRQQLTTLDPHYSISGPAVPHALAASLAQEHCHPALLSTGQPLTIRAKPRHASDGPTRSPVKAGSPRRQSPRKLGKENSPRKAKENSPHEAALHSGSGATAFHAALQDSSAGQSESPKEARQSSVEGQDRAHQPLPAFASIEAPMTTARLKASLGDFSIARILAQASGVGCASALDTESSYELL